MKKGKKKSIRDEYRFRTPTQEVMHRFKKNIGAMIGLGFLLVLVFLAVFADVIFDYEDQVVFQNYEIRMQKPSWQHPFGTDNLGRDQFVRLLYGTKYSLPIGAVAVLLGLSVGMVLGSFAGYYGGAIDNAIMRFLDIFGAVPSFLMAMCLIVAFGGSGIFPLMLALGINSITSFARITRASVLSSRNQEYVESALAIGQNHFEIIFKHVIPNSLSPIIVQVTLKMGSEIIAASSLSYLGLGVLPPTPEWGALLSAGRSYVRNASYLTLFPGLMIMLTVIAFNMVGDGLRDAMDPKLKK